MWLLLEARSTINETIVAKPFTHVLSPSSQAIPARASGLELEEMIKVCRWWAEALINMG